MDIQDFITSYTIEIPSLTSVSKMSKREHKSFMCVHAPCSFKTDKRKAIYTHLVRTHNERKEDYECEYCSSMFELDSEIERHLHVHHQQQPFTYTCVSRIEKVINKCAKLGSDSKSLKSPSISPSVVDNSCEASAEKTPPKVDGAFSISKPPYLKPNISMRTRASVNESLNNIAKLPRYSGGEENTKLTQKECYVEDEYYDDNDDDDLEEVEIDTDEETPTYVSKPSGLKIKLSLKKSSSNTSRELSSERSPPLLEPSGETEIDSSDFPNDIPPDIIRTQTISGTAQVRVKDSKYYDKLEVYHHTDEFGRRCCPFCEYKTSKNTIRVHLSGIHKIHFVKCSLCDYKAAFPHQITQHGIKFHKTKNLNVIQLSKESRDRTISQLKRLCKMTTPSTLNKTKAVNIKPADDMGTGSEIIDDEDFNSEESYPTSTDENDTSICQADDRVFKPPKCQTSKTDYYSIRIENGVYLYSCNLCTFQTPVRATIYTHKYRHEEKSYRCGYCDFTSAPRSNVVHHCRVKHKGSPVNVVENDIEEHYPLDVKEFPQDEEIGPAKLKNMSQPSANIVVKSEPTDDNLDLDNYQELDNINMASKVSNEISTNHHQMIIKVPQYKRSITSVSYDSSRSSAEIKRPKLEAETIQAEEYKLSLNKLYRVNPTGSPKFMCAMCSYACDTHPKMKHHLYRHRPQKYKCPYCDHRKYPRSYVVRHVRDTHRNKPVRVIDLSKGNEPEDIPEYMNDVVTDDTLDDTTGSLDTNEAHMSTFNQEADAQVHNQNVLEKENAAGDDMNAEQNEEVNALKNFAQKLNLRSVLTADLNDDLFMQSSDISPNCNDYMSSPLIESFINGQYQNTSTPKLNAKNFEKKKSLKDYRVNYGQGPRYICNKCGYGTENYKTIHNHMYRHESQRYQCPYCGYRRSPKSFVENHIREVHKGHPVIVTELTIDQEMTDAPIGSPRQCVTLKRKDPHQDATPSSQVKKDEESSTTKIPAKWPAPKPVSHLNVTKPHFQVSPVLNVITDNSTITNIPQLSPSIVQLTQTNILHKDVKDNVPELVPAMVTNPLLSMSVSSNALRFVERNRTTFKTMYKCVFDPETCNHISKDKSKMKQHLFMHVEYKPWTCDFCDMTASQSSHIKNHVRTEHPGVADTSFKYKRHNYLEKHIEGFLNKGLFTVPVNEYRAIMDMKGNTKSSKQPIFERDEEGNLLCPYCSYRTKSGGMTDHIKMKHMQPRFKCHWCDYRAFYRSEVRKHHRKEKSHADHEFKTQELDLAQAMEGYKERNESAFGTDVASSCTSNYNPSQFLDDEEDDDDNHDDDDDDDDDDDLGSECWSSEGSSIGDYQQGYVEYTTEQLSNLCASKQLKVDIHTECDTATKNDCGPSQVRLESINTEVGPGVSMEIVQMTTPESNEAIKSNPAKDSKFKCGYCPFSADLRVKVKMHCSKKHSEKVINIIEPAPKPETALRQDNIDLGVDDWKGTKFEQDLRMAGVSKLNLASLFPHSKRFHKSNSSSHSVVKLDEDKTEFKKPLEPIAKVKTLDRKIENALSKEGATIITDKTIDNLSNVRDNQEISKKSGENLKRDTNSAKSNILISDVRSIKQENTPTSKTEDTKDEIVQNLKTNFKVKDKVQTAFPNHTTVILEDETNDENTNRNDTESVSINTEALEDVCEEKRGNRCAQNIYIRDSCSVDIEENNENKADIVSDSVEGGNNENITKLDSCEIDSDVKMPENTGPNIDETLPYEKDDIHFTNGHKFSIDGTIKESYDIENNDQIMKEIICKSYDKTNNTEILIKLDGTSDVELDSSVKDGIDVLKSALT